MRVPEIEDCLHKRLPFIKVFPAGQDKDDFTALHLAEDWVRERGYEVGAHEKHFPIGLARDCDYIAKWGNIDFWERHKLDGVIIPGPGGFRGGSATILLSEDPDADQNKTT